MSNECNNSYYTEIYKTYTIIHMRLNYIFIIIQSLYPFIIELIFKFVDFTYLFVYFHSEKFYDMMLLMRIVTSYVAKYHII